MPLVAARKPSGSDDRSKVAETLRRRPLSDDEAALRFGTAELSSEGNVESFPAGVGSMAGKGSTSLFVGDDGIVDLVED